MMKTVNIVDRTFDHDLSSCMGRPPANFSWRWLGEEDGYHFPDAPIFFTDKMLERAPFYSAGRKIALLLEPDGIARRHYDYVEKNLDEFEVILTFDRHLLSLGDDRIRPYRFGGCWIPDEDIKLYEKTKFCSIIASSKDVTEGHKLRHKVIRELAEFSGIDVYGRGYTPVDAKLEALADYRYTIVIENCKQDDYFSEKLIDALATGTVPLYWGTSKVGNYFDISSILRFRNVVDLRDTLETERDVEFTQYRSGLEVNIQRIDQFKLVEDGLWRDYPDLFTTVEQPKLVYGYSFSRGKRNLESRVSQLEDKLHQTRVQRDKIRAERERARHERDTARAERNEARAQRDQLKFDPKFAYLPDDDSFYFDDEKAFLAQGQKSAHREAFAPAKRLPIVNEKDVEIGEAKGHYFFQDLHVARRVIDASPERHFDVASRVDGFVAHVAASLPVTVLEIRDVPTRYDRITYRQADVMDLDPDLVGCCDSLSCLHVIEHFGLGRYGDPIDFEGHLKGLDGLTRMLRSGGTFYLSTPIGTPRIHFNAHRVFGVRYLLDLLKESFELQHFSWIGDDGFLREHVELSDHDIAENLGCHFGCGIFELTKK